MENDFDICFVIVSHIARVPEVKYKRDFVQEIIETIFIRNEMYKRLGIIDLLAILLKEVPKAYTGHLRIT